MHWGVLEAEEYQVIDKMQQDNKDTRKEKVCRAGHKVGYSIAFMFDVHTSHIRYLLLHSSIFCLKIPYLDDHNNNVTIHLI
jgi:hypothetical protein